MIDKKSMLKNLKKAVKSDAKRRIKAELELDIKPFRGNSWAPKPHYKWDWKLNKAVRL